MRNLIFRNREKQAWLDYSLDLLFTLLLFVQGDRVWAYLFILLTFVDIVFLAFVPDIEDKWWYKAITVIVSIIVVIYVGISLVRFFGANTGLKDLNLPL